MNAPRRPRRGYPDQNNIPSQAPSDRTPYMPGRNQADVGQFPPLQQQHEHGYGGAPPVYVVSTYDARPINAVDFNTYTGTNPNDTGFSGAGQITASTFYTVQPGRVAVLRDWHLLVVPTEGEPIGETTPIINPSSGASNFRAVLSFLVDGQFQEGQSGLVLWSLPFGDVFGNAYVIAQEGQTIEMRLTGSGAGSNWSQALMAMHGNLLQAKGYQPQFAPGTDVSLPVVKKDTTALNIQSGG